MRLVREQDFEGAWDVTELLSELSGVDFDHLLSVVRQLEKTHSNASKIVGTCAALFLLHTLFSDREDEWRLIAEKATAWIQMHNILLPEYTGDLMTWMVEIMTQNGLI